MFVLFLFPVQPCVFPGVNRRHELLDNCEMPNQISGEHVIDENLPELLLVFLRDFAQYVILFSLENLESEGAVVILQNTFIIIDERLARADCHHECIVEAGVADVMHCRAEEKGNGFELVQRGITCERVSLRPQFRKKAQEFVTSMAWIEL